MMPATDSIASAAPASSWRSIYRVHPAAEVFPMMPDAEIEALAADIRANGLRQPVVLWQAPGVLRSTISNFTTRDWIVVDGRNRLAALERLGVVFSADKSVRTFRIQLPDGTYQTLFHLLDDDLDPVDPVAYVISANIRRRHLTKEQQAELIVKTIEAGRRAANDSAKVARSFSPVPGVKGGSTKDPVLEQAVAEGKKHGLSKRTMQRGAAKVRGTKPTKKKPPQTTRAQTFAAPMSVVHTLRELRAEITARRKANRDERNKSRWTAAAIVTRFQTELLDWIEDQLDRVGTAIDRGASVRSDRPDGRRP
jgi:hypothetical protein